MGIQRWKLLRRSRRNRRALKSLRYKPIENEPLDNRLLDNVRSDELMLDKDLIKEDEVAETTNNNELFNNPLVDAHKNLMQNSAVINDIKNALWEQLEIFQLSHYLNGPMMGMTSDLDTFKFRIKDFLYFIHHKLEPQDKTNGFVHIDSTKLMRNFILRDFMLLPEYCAYLKDVCGHRPFTIRNYLEHISKFLEWFVLYRKGDFKRMHSRHLDAMKKLIKRIRHQNNKDIKVSMSSNTIETLIEQRKWPSGGLKELQTAIENEICWVNKLSQPISTQKSYNRFMQVLCSAAYCFSPQGRCGAYDDLKYGQRESLVDNGYVLSSKFKTRSKFGYQPITSNKVFEKLLKFYIERIRPKRLQDDNDPLFITFSGSGVYSVRLSVPKFFLRTLNIHINTTTIRAIVETTMHKLQVYTY